jgi:hypothetical protein
MYLYEKIGKNRAVPPLRPRHGPMIWSGRHGLASLRVVPGLGRAKLLSSLGHSASPTRLDTYMLPVLEPRTRTLTDEEDKTMRWRSCAHESRTRRHEDLALRLEDSRATSASWTRSRSSVSSMATLPALKVAKTERLMEETTVSGRLPRSLASSRAST